MRLNVYGRLMELERKPEGWCVYYLGQEGKKRLAEGIVIPAEITDEKVAVQYIADLCHEWITSTAAEIKILDQ